MFIFLAFFIFSTFGLALLAYPSFHLSLSSSTFSTVFGDWNIVFDFTSVAFVSLLFLVTSFILVFSHNYIASDRLRTQFLIVLGSFAFSIIILILRERLPLFFLGWDGLGISRFWLILWYQNTKGNISGAHTFSTMRAGDLLLILAIVFWAGSQSGNLYIFGALAIGFFIFGAATKSAQVPFTTWLPLAIAAPTPVRALVHSSTLVTAGIYILARLIFYGGPVIPSQLATLGLLTATVGAVCSTLEFDLKKAIAYSTLSHCGLMVYGLGINAWDIVFFHLCVHAIFKRLLFLLAGWSLSTVSGAQDIRLLGGLTCPSLKTVWAINGLIMASLPRLGVWYRKHAIIALQQSWDLIQLTLFSILTVLSAVYIWRLISISFLPAAPAAGSVPSVYKIFLFLHIFLGIMMVMTSPLAVADLAGSEWLLNLLALSLLIPVVLTLILSSPNWLMSAQNYIDQFSYSYLALPRESFESNLFEQLRRRGASVQLASQVSSLISITYWGKRVIVATTIILILCI